MKNTTEYLFDRPAETYEPHLTILASRRVADATVLLSKLAGLRETTAPEDMDALIERYQAVEKAKLWWQETK